MRVLPELLLRPPFGVGILLPAFSPELPALTTAGPLPAVDTDTEHRCHVRREAEAQVGAQGHGDSVGGRSQ